MGKPKFTRIPKVTDLITAGVPAEVIPTYCCLADHANNKTGLCWPKMETIAATLNRSVRTIQRHLQRLKACGLIEFVQRRRYKGRFSSYLYKVLHIVTTGHRQQLVTRRPNRRRTKASLNSPQTPKSDPKEGYSWLFGKAGAGAADAEHQKQRRTKRQEEAKRRTDGFEWLFA